MTRREHDLSVSCLGVARQSAYDIALLPWGATEPHNLHLPYLTDAILARDLAVDAAMDARERFGIMAMVMPPVALGAQNPGQREQPFCVHTRYATQEAVLRDIVASLYHQGMRRLLIVNGHGGNSFKPMIRDLAVDFPDMRIAACEWYRMAQPKEYFDRPGDHADEVETSVMMHYHPELVDLSEAGSGKSRGFAAPVLSSGKVWLPRNWNRVSTDTGIGDPSASTPEKGRRFATVCASEIAEAINALCAENLYE